MDGVALSSPIWSNVCLFSISGLGISDLGISGEVSVLPLSAVGTYCSPMQMGLGIGDCRECGEGCATMLF